MSMRKPNLFIVGAPKCGTTSMYIYLRQHPDIYMSEVKEPNYFNIDLYSPKFLRDENQYLSLFKDAKNEKRVGEASPWYLYSKNAAEEIFNFCGLVKIIIMLRNPIEMMHSVHSQQVFNGYEKFYDFETALNAENDRKLGKHLTQGAFLKEGLYYREVARFTPQIKRYYDVFGRENVHIITLEDLRENPEAEYVKTLMFLEIHLNYYPNFIVHNKNRRIRSSILRRTIKEPPQYLSWLMKRRFSPSQRKWLRQKLKRVNTRHGRRGKITPELRRDLEKELELEIEQLSILIGRDVSHWVKGVSTKI